MGWIGDALGALGGVVSGLFGANANKEAVAGANEMNYRINERNLAQQRELFNQQLAYNWDMFNAQNTWNSPQEVRRRYEQAGFNPFMMMDSTGTAPASGSSAPSASVPSMIPMQPEKYDTGAISDVAGAISSMVTAVADARLKSSKVVEQNIENKYHEERVQRELWKLMQEGHLTWQQRIAAEYANKVTGQSINAQIQAALKQPEFMEAQINALSRRAAYDQSMTDLNNAQLPYIPYSLYSEIMLRASQVGLNEANASKANAERLESVKRTIKLSREVKILEKEYNNTPWLNEQQVDQVGKSMVNQAVGEGNYAVRRANGRYEGQVILTPEQVDRMARDIVTTTDWQAAHLVWSQVVRPVISNVSGPLIGFGLGRFSKGKVKVPYAAPASGMPSAPWSPPGKTFPY